MEAVISIHALLAESDSTAFRSFSISASFQSTLSLRRATVAQSGGGMCTPNFNPRSPCGERRSPGRERHQRNRISIHALLAESDSFLAPHTQSLAISIHALLAESDGYSLPAGKARLYFNPRSPCGERLAFFSSLEAPSTISIHALLAESDVTLHRQRQHQQHFNPRSPCGERHNRTGPGSRPGDFNPRSPCGERRNLNMTYYQRHQFQSTLSLRRATLPINHLPASVADFNPRSPCGERLFITFWLMLCGEDFNPRSPCGERPLTVTVCADTTDFNPRSPCGERPSTSSRSGADISISIHALLAESDPCFTVTVMGLSSISIHALLAESDRSDGRFRSVPLISIHALLAESDQIFSDPGHWTELFQSTLSLRRATSRPYQTPRK